ncbi:hypothetical protein F5884DRAFT_546946 [Xylogone sp. PMI_703]|nr:hypothetical protein F5884DRAFT_546946 [Xylogone sp. PMI_703]
MAFKLTQLSDVGATVGSSNSKSEDGVVGDAEETNLSQSNPKVFQSLEFINVNPTTQDEQQRNKRAIRSAAMRSYRQRQKKQREMELEMVVAIQQSNKSTNISAKKSSNIKVTALEDSTLAVQPYIPDTTWTAITSTDWQEHSTFDDESNGFVIDAIEQSESSTPGLSNPDRDYSSNSSVTSPLSLVGQGRVDPFCIQDVNVDVRFHELMDHSLTMLWPGFRVPGLNGSASHHPSAWLQKSYERPIVKHAMLFGASVHMDVLRSPHTSLKNPVRLYHKVQTMKLLKEELNNPKKASAPLDDVILSVLTLSTNEVELIANVDGPGLRSPFNSPMASLQWLDIYGSINHIPAHTTAMRSLVDKRGGLEKIELTGLAEVICFSDILGATQGLSKPYWPLLARIMPAAYEAPDFPPKTISKQFLELQTLGISNEATAIFQAIADLTVVIDHHCRGINFISDINVFVRQRNTLQYRLMSLPKGEELEYGEVQSVCLYESIRHAAILFSAAVTFPLPPHSGIFHTLAARLRAIMEESRDDLCWQLYPETLLWILVLGGIAASGTAHRDWYVQNLNAVSTALKVFEWEEAEKMLSEFLWLKSACETGGRALWLEVVNDRAVLQHSRNGHSVS